jgi:Zn-dependent membrane protease YugP
MNAYMLYYATGVIMIPVLLFSIYCQIKVKRAFRRYSSVHAMCGMTGAQAAARLLQLNGIIDVQIRQIGGTLTDYYDPKNKEICLSGDVYNATSVAAIGVAFPFAAERFKCGNHAVVADLRLGRQPLSVIVVLGTAGSNVHLGIRPGVCPLVIQPLI